MTQLKDEAILGLLTSGPGFATEVLESMDVAVYTTDAEGVITFYNDAAARLWGRRPMIGRDLWCGSWRILRPDGTVLPHEDCPMAVALKEMRQVRGEVAIAERPDGSRVWFMPYPTPLRNAVGEMVGAVNVLIDISEQKREELRAQDSENRLRQLIEGIGVPLYATDARGYITYFNEPAAKLWGRRPLLGVDRWCGSMEMLDADGNPLPLDRCPMALVLEQGRPIAGVEAQIRRPDGSTVWVEPYPTPLFDAAGNVNGAINIFLDITERKRAEIASLRLKAIVESAEDAIVSKDLDGTIRSWNPGAEKMFGYTAEEAIGRSIRVIIPADRQGEEDDILARISRGERVEHFRTVRRRKDGTFIDVSLSISPIPDSSGRILGASKIARDITAETAFERTLQASETKFRTLTSLAPVGIFLTDAAGDLVMVNGRWLDYAGMAESQALGRGWLDVVHPDDREDLVAEWYGAVERREEFAGEYRFRRRDGHVTWLRSTATPLPGALGQPGGYVGTITDITNLKEAEALKDQFLGLISHELRTPLATIYGSSRFLHDRHDRVGEEERLLLLTDVVAEAERLQRIIENLLLITRLSAGQLELEPVALGILLERCAATFSSRYPGRELVRSIPPGIPTVLGNDMYVELVVENLLNNAHKYSPGDRPIRLEACPASDGVEVRILDEGMGVDPEDLSRVFDPFFRSIEARKVASGAGIGLAVCKRVVEAQGGTIWVRRRPGGGTEFGFRLSTLADPD
jgi:PAS domain S-box-containing protein